MAADHPAERRSAETDAVSGPPVSRPPASGTATAFVDPDATVKPPRDAPPSASGSVGRIDPIGSTAPDEAGARPPPSVARFPVRDWDRYKPERLLGQGGMGTVFLAWDVRLQRHVALKFVRSDSPQHTARLLVEARAQARVHHERVCQVYEVGEVQDQVYIAMQFVDGQPLGVAARSLSFEQRAMVIRDAALGLHEAHRAGIVHRDVKPSNIMIERAEDGQIRTYVMDFGLARDHKDTDAETGTVMGTPAYMSPEQARGEVGRLDRRADVYSLGATLYQVLCGQPPIPGANGLELLHNIASTEPRPPEAIDRDIPGELSAIALTCLEKERGARYESARALADDLDRFLNGEPIRARRAGSWYRLRKRIRKQRGLVAAGTLATVLVIAALAWGLQIRSQAEERERLARRFSERVEQVEAIARYSALSRAHDIRGDRERILARVRELSAEIGVAGPLAAGPGAYAIGRGYMALGDDAKAHEALESAWEKGFREPRAAYALALVTGHLYQRELVEAERIRNDALRAAKKKEIEARYRDPALAYLRKSDGADVPSKEYVAALIAYYEGHFDEALAHVDAIGDALPWFYEAPELRGDVLFARGLAAHRGGDGARAKADFEAGRAAYARACAVAESVPDVWAAAAALEYQDMVLELYGEGDVEPPFARGIAATSRALAVMPDDRASLLLAARLRRSLAEHRTTRGEKVDDLLDSAARDAERAVALSPSDPVARLELSRVHRQRGEAEAALGADPSAALTKALAVVEPVEAADRGYEFQVNLGLVFTVWADHEDEIGASSVENRGKSIDAYLAAIAQDPRLTEAFINLAAAYQERASRAQAKDPDGDLRAAAEALDKALALQPSHVVALYYKGNVHKEIAERLRSHGADAKAELLRAKEAYEAGLAINPKLHYLHNGVGLALTNIARDAWDRGEPAEPLLLQAKAAFERAIAIAPDQSLFRDSLGLAHLARARCVRSLGGDPEEDLASAEAAFKEAVGLHADDALAWAHVAWVHVVRAERALDRATDAAPALASATAAIEKALAANPNEPDAHLALGEIGRLKARALARRGTASEAEYQRASEAYKKSLELAPNDQDARVMIAWFDREWAAWRVDQRRDARPIVDEALDMLAPVLTARPAWADARALRGALLLQRARAANEGAREIATKATEDLDAALQTNPNLERRFRADEIAAKQLTTP